MKHPDVRGGTGANSPDGQWEVMVMDGPISTDQDGATIKVRKGGAPSSSDKEPEMKFEMPLPDFNGRSRDTTVIWSKEGDRCVVHVEGRLDKANITVVPAKHLFVCEMEVERSVVFPLTGTIFVFSVVLAAVIFGWMVRKGLAEMKEKAKESAG